MHDALNLLQAPEKIHTRHSPSSHLGFVNEARFISNESASEHLFCTRKRLLIIYELTRNFYVRSANIWVHRHCARLRRAEHGQRLTGETSVVVVSFAYTYEHFGIRFRQLWQSLASSEDRYWESSPSAYFFPSRIALWVSMHFCSHFDLTKNITVGTVCIA